MELTSDWISKLRELIPDARQRGVLTTVLQKKSDEERRQIFDDDDEAVRASLEYLHKEAIFNQLSSTGRFVQSFLCCLPGSIDEEHASLDLNNEGRAVAEPLEHVREWKEWFWEIYDKMLRVGKRIGAAVSSAFDAVRRAVRSAVNSFMELLQRKMESMSSFFHSINLILQKLVNAILANFPAYNSHAHHT